MARVAAQLVAASELKKTDVSAGIIDVIDATEHNLKNVNVKIPKGQVVVFTGPSGCGKSSLVFHTIYAEAFRRYSDASGSQLYLMGSGQVARTKRPKVQAIRGLPPALGLSQRQGVAGKLSTVGTISGVSDLLRVYFAAFGDIFCSSCHIPLKALKFETLLEKILLEFNQKQILIMATIAEKRKGGFASELEKMKKLGFSKVKVNDEIFSLQEEENQFKIDSKKLNTIEVVVDSMTVAEEKKGRLERSLALAIEHGAGLVKLEHKGLFFIYNTKNSCPQCGESSPKIDPRYFSHSSLGQCESCEGTGLNLSLSDFLPEDLFPCSACQGTRLSPARSPIKCQELSFEELQKKTCEWLRDYFTIEHANLDSSEGNKSRKKVLSEIQRCLDKICEVGLGYLTLARSGSSLSPGDLQRLRLAGMISNRLHGALYVIDEPCQGLTQPEVLDLMKVLKNITSQGSSVLAVEHHPEFLKGCDTIFEMGPGAGEFGGEVLTSAIESKKEKRKLKPSELISFQKNSELEQRQGKKSSCVEFNLEKLRNLDKKKVFVLPQGVTLLRGAAGTGKSTFVQVCLVPFLQERILQSSKKEPENKCFLELCKPKYWSKTLGSAISNSFVVSQVIEVKPGSLSRSSRRSLASALDILTFLRGLFSQLPASQLNGLTESHFSWNSKLGRCHKCEGKGYIELPHRYGPPVNLECDLCLGAKLNSKSLLPRYKGLNFAEVMNLSLEKTLSYFYHVRQIQVRLQSAVDFGLGYLKLGQTMDMLSGGELQRLTLSIELKRANLEGCWFILHYPGTGLHAPDIEKLGGLMHAMKLKGAKFFLIENREEFAKFADEIIVF
jgi:excinuclease ABC subunit A